MFADDTDDLSKEPPPWDLNNDSDSDNTEEDLKNLVKRMSDKFCIETGKQAAAAAAVTTPKRGPIRDPRHVALISPGILNLLDDSFDLAAQSPPEFGE